MNDYMKSPYFKGTSFPGMKTETRGTQETTESGPEIPFVDLPQFIRMDKTGDRVYFVKGREAHWVRDPQTFAELGGHFEKVVTLENDALARIKIMEPISMRNVEQYKTQVQIEAPKPEDHSVGADKMIDGPSEIAIPKTEDSGENVLKMEVVPGLTSIIIPAYFKDYSLFHYTGNCIGSIHEHTDKTETPYEIILVINGKDHPFGDALEKTYANKVIVSDTNEGYSKAVNKGLRASQGEYVVVMNNDVMVFDQWLEFFQKSLKIRDLVMATPMYGMPFARAVQARELLGKQEGKILEETISDFRDFSCFITRRTVFEQIGTFDEKFFAYKEDVDLVKRMEAKGMKIGSSRLVNTFHVIGATSTNMSEEDLHKREGTDYFASKYENR